MKSFKITVYPKRRSKTPSCDKRSFFFFKAEIQPSFSPSDFFVSFFLSMFVPTIKYKRVNESSIKEEKPEEIVKKDEEPKEIVKKDEEPKEIVREDQPKEETNKVTEEYVFEEEGTEAITVDPNDKDRIIITLSTGKQYSADRYCPHAGADLSYHGKLGESDYPPEIGPIVLCQFHYWEFALERNGDGFGGRATINACPVGEKCSSKELDW